MPPIHPAYLAHERQRWLRPDAHRFLRPDWRRFVTPGSELAAYYESIEQKYRPDQARVPAGNPDGVQWTDEEGRARSEDDDKSPANANPTQHSPSREGWHQYRSGPNLVCPADLHCSKEEIADQLARYSVPGRDPTTPVENGGIYSVYDPDTGVFVGSVSTTVSQDGLSVKNTTQPGHIFYDGSITRTARQWSSGLWTVTTEGTGNNVVLGTNYVNEAVGPSIFTDLDRQMRANIERHHAKGAIAAQTHRARGCRSLAVRRGLEGMAHG